jgi:hypothetical protein
LALPVNGEGTTQEVDCAFTTPKPFTTLPFPPFQQLIMYKRFFILLISSDYQYLKMKLNDFLLARKRRYSF